jgi:phosphatidylserine/phosphatidylglycerophosphate/cardiolipin synthase-like enzyme
MKAMADSAQTGTAQRARPGGRTLILALALLLLAQLACDGAGLLDGGFVVREEVAGDWIRIYFTVPSVSDGEAARQSGLVQGLISALDQAEESIDLAAYDFDLDSVAAALVAAEQRGLRVRVVTESENVPDNAHTLVALERAGIPVVEDRRESGLMHNKFAVIDGDWIWSGSWNLTHNGTYRNNNHAVLITSSALAENYTAEFEEMVARQFGPDSPRNTPNPHLIISVGGADETQRRVEVENYFAPEDQVAREIIAEIAAAQERIRFLAFVFTSEELADAMLERSREGVVVQGVIEDRNAGQPYSQYDRLRAAVHDVLTDGNPYIMHHKVIIIDDETVILGSYNFSHSAETTNDENLLIIHDPAVADLFVEEFGRVYQQARSAE